MTTRARRSALAVLVGLVLLFSPSVSFPAEKGKSSKPSSHPSTATAVRYAEAISKGDLVETARLDFACLYRLVSAAPRGTKSYPDKSDGFYQACWQSLKVAHEPALKRVDVGMDILWPSNGGLVYFGDELDRYPASAFV